MWWEDVRAAVTPLLAGAMGLLWALASPRYICLWLHATGIPLTLPACALHWSRMPGWAPLAVLWAGERG